jgi:hypothetical protein
MATYFSNLLVHHSKQPSVLHHNIFHYVIFINGIYIDKVFYVNICNYVMQLHHSTCSRQPWVMRHKQKLPYLCRVSQLLNL